ncbi:hypothetical protein A3Q56_03198 [Intoshia linei]|uniref:Eukaryotic translation initiation factor 6 n=1 Tax=Intoshia linei TaxID=1819745 RepID=A0A177B5S3_9BILA|nr:hypothetical protein A3Q56_03198 [Intoshia linei]
MIVKTHCEGSSEIGVFSKLTNKYCLVGIADSQNFYSTFESELPPEIPVFNALINNTKIIGRMCIGNSKGLLLPHITTDNELKHITNSMPDGVRVKRINERYTALGNMILNNDYVALVHHEISKETEEDICDVLGVEVFRHTIGSNVLAGSYGVLSNKGGLLHSAIKLDERKELSELLGLPLLSGTLNSGCDLIGAGLVVNDWVGFCGLKTTATEMAVIESIFNLDDHNNVEISESLRDPMIEKLL